jgi:hypothetical protein
MMDEVAIWHRLLTAEDVKKLYNENEGTVIE